jgi:hypothetical protein
MFRSVDSTIAVVVAITAARRGSRRAATASTICRAQQIRSGVM